MKVADGWSGERKLQMLLDTLASTIFLFLLYPPILFYKLHIIIKLSVQSNSDTGVLQEFGDSTRDLNVEPAWIQGVTGCNVIVGVVDDGEW